MHPSAHVPTRLDSVYAEYTVPATDTEQDLSAPQARPQPQIVLILVGLIGSGKSTFAQALQQHRPDFLRCNQDELGSRRRVEEVARYQLQQGRSVCIDRTNIDASQRETWIRIAREVPGALAWVLLFDTPLNICEQRLQNRVGHPTITSAEHGLSILRRFSSQYQPPFAQEGYDQFLRLDVIDQPLVYSADDITRILDRLRISPHIAAEDWGFQGSAQRPGRRGFYRGSHSRGRSPTSPGGHNSYRGGRGGYARGGRGQSSVRGSSYMPRSFGMGESRERWQGWRTSNDNSGS